MPVALMYSTYYGYFSAPIGDCGSWEVSSGFEVRIHPIRGTLQGHKGVDISGSGSEGVAVAAADGYIAMFCVDLDDPHGYDYNYEDGTGYGNYIVLEHTDFTSPDFPYGMYTLYGHLATVDPTLKPGSFVTKGQRLGGFVGPDGMLSGGSTGPHVHWETRPIQGGFFGSEAMDPALFLEGIELGSGSAGSSTGGALHGHEGAGTFNQFQNKIFEFKYELLKGFRDLFETISKTIVEGMRRIHEVIRSIFILLIMIDLALGTMFQILKGEEWYGRYVVGYFVYKFLFYGMMLLLIQNFSNLANHFVRDLFISSAGRAMNVQEAEVVRIVSDPMLIVEKGMYIIQPFINYGLDFSWNILASVAVRLLPEQLAGIVDAPSFFEAIIVFIFCLTFIIMIFFVACMIALAYIEFYLMILVSFTTMIFAGTKQTRQYRLANRGLSGVFAGALNLMFYCLFSLMLTNSLVAIASQVKAVTTTSTVTRQVRQSGFGVNGTYMQNARSVYDDFKAAGYSDEAIAGILGRLQQENNFDPSAGYEREVWMEEYGEYWTLGGYGMYQWNGGRTNEYLDWAASNGYNPEDPHAQNLYAIKEANERGCSPSVMNGMSATQAAEYWTDKWEVGEHGNEAYYAEEWREQIAEWNGSGNPDSSKDKSGKDSPSTGRTKQVKRQVVSGLNNLMILIQLNLCVLVFVILGTRISRSINSLFKGGGFDLLNSQNE